MYSLGGFCWHGQGGHAGLGWPCRLRITGLCHVLDACKSFKIILYWDKCKGFFGHCWNPSLMLEVLYSLTSYILARHSSVAAVFLNTSISLHSWEPSFSSFKKNSSWNVNLSSSMLQHVARSWYFFPMLWVDPVQTLLFSFMFCCLHYNERSLQEVQVGINCSQLDLPGYLTVWCQECIL